MPFKPFKRAVVAEPLPSLPAKTHPSTSSRHPSNAPASNKHEQHAAKAVAAAKFPRK